jgi:uncharacterized protein YndB with AHSA1/START domain
MAQASAGGGSTRVSRVIKAPRAKVYQAFLDPEAVAAWLSPGTMRLHVHAFEAREGGAFRISLTYPTTDHSQPGKTSADTDTYHGRFVRLVPNEKIVEAIEFETQDPAFAGVMTMMVTLADVDGGTEVSLLYENVPAGIRPEDNEAGSRSALEKLAALVEPSGAPWPT